MLLIGFKDTEATYISCYLKEDQINLKYYCIVTHDVVVSMWPDTYMIINIRYQSSWGQYGAHLGPVGPRWAPYGPHEPRYLGSFQHFILSGGLQCVG